jgi:hypothetical protein
VKLLFLQLPDSKPRDLGHVRSIDFAHPQDQVLGWRVMVRGPAVILLAPKGHHLAGGWEFSRAHCSMRWDSTEPSDFKDMVNWTSEPLERAKPEPVPAMDVPQKVAAK